MLNNFLEFCESAGWVTLPLALISVVSWYWILVLYRKLTRSVRRTANFERQLSDFLYKGQRGELENFLASEEGTVPRILNYSLNSSETLSQALHRYEEASSAEMGLVQKEFGVVKTLVQAAPLLGLLGTVIGMIETFGVFALDLGSSPDMMAKGISKALLTTQIGLVVALPGIFASQYLQSLRKRFQAELQSLEFHVRSFFQVESKESQS